MSHIFCDENIDLLSTRPTAGSRMVLITKLSIMLIDDCSHNVLEWNLGTVYLYALYGVEIRRIGKTVVFIPKALYGGLHLKVGISTRSTLELPSCK